MIFFNKHIVKKNYKYIKKTELDKNPSLINVYLVAPMKTPIKVRKDKKSQQVMRVWHSFIFIDRPQVNRDNKGEIYRVPKILLFRSWYTRDPINFNVGIVLTISTFA